MIGLSCTAGAVLALCGQVRQIVGVFLQRPRRLWKAQIVQDPSMADPFPQVAESAA